MCVCVCVCVCMCACVCVRACVYVKIKIGQPLTESRVPLEMCSKIQFVQPCAEMG